MQSIDEIREKIRNEARSRLGSRWMDDKHLVPLNSVTVGTLEPIPKILDLLENASMLLDVADTYDLLLDIRFAGYLIQNLRRRLSLSLDITSLAGKLRLRAEFKLGEFLRGIVKNQGGRPLRKTPLLAKGVSAKTLREYHISYSQAMIWERMASVPQDLLEEYFERMGPIYSVRGFFAYAGIEYPYGKKPVISPKEDENLEILELLGQMTLKVNYLWKALGDLRDAGKLSNYDYARIEMDLEEGRYQYSPSPLVREFGEIARVPFPRLK